MLLEGSLNATREKDKYQVTNPDIYNGDLPVWYSGVIVVQELWEKSIIIWLDLMSFLWDRTYAYTVWVTKNLRLDSSWT